MSLIGGLAMFGSLVAGLLVADQIPQLRDNAFPNTWVVSGLVAKAAGQVAVGGILVATGTRLTWLPLPGGNTFLPNSDQATVLTILIVVVTINAVNFFGGRVAKFERRFGLDKSST